MKKTTSLMLMLLFSALMLIGEAFNTTAEADLCCDQLVGCCNAECCYGPGTPTGCTLNCQNGTIIQCPKKKGC